MNCKNCAPNVFEVFVYAKKLLKFFKKFSAFKLTSESERESEQRYVKDERKRKRK